ncbi:DUF3283 family protein [Vibrio quintilis]|uniref:Pyridoxamine 5'-phosphate oxidase n=1 Tax=Vibrio quintilis TaxID=1117707 RepID=A0A1M7YPL7_9VIBR|nr:DUF3283 family protein [Vibrio quintilis]SHO54554.1 hypothetical protein VQ7734_00268 [Vibrio quintilis]
MSFNLAELAAGEKNRIELDKQAAFLVWKLKQGKAGPEEITKYISSIRSADEQTWFQQCVEKYKRVMGVM